MRWHPRAFKAMTVHNNNSSSLRASASVAAHEQQEEDPSSGSTSASVSGGKQHESQSVAATAEELRKNINDDFITSVAASSSGRHRGKHGRMDAKSKWQQQQQQNYYYDKHNSSNNTDYKGDWNVNDSALAALGGDDAEDSAAMIESHEDALSSLYDHHHEQQEGDEDDDHTSSTNSNHGGEHEQEFLSSLPLTHSVSGNTMYSEGSDHALLPGEEGSSQNVNNSTNHHPADANDDSNNESTLASANATSSSAQSEEVLQQPQPTLIPTSALSSTVNDTTAVAHTWRPQTQQSTCEFSHVICNYSKKRESGCKKAEYSPITVDSYGNRWRLIVYVNGNGRASNHHLSLFLQVADSDDLPFGWKKAVSYVLTLEHPSNSSNNNCNSNDYNNNDNRGPNNVTTNTTASTATTGSGSLGYSKRNPDKTFKLCPKAIDWGWSQFITSDRIQQEGYIHDDSLTVRATVTVKSSSVNIDPADAELYLKYAVEEGKADAVKTCLEQGASVNCQFKDDLYTPLHTACSSSSSNGSLEVLNLLLERGADPNACNKWRETPLLIAANNGHREAVEALLDHGADPSMCSEAGWSALTFAAHKGYDEIVELLLESGAPVNCQVTEDLSTPLHKACAGGKNGHLSAVKQLIDGGADVHALNKWRETPLLTAANHGQAAAVEALLESGADSCKCTDTGWSPLSIAAYKGHDEVVRLLLEEGAPTEEADPTLSALLQAATKGLPKTVELLLAHGADHTVTTKKGDTALSILVEQNLIDAAVEMVTEYRASIPRCSRDRKKVQRAKLLINHRVKQQEKEGKFKGRMVESSDDESDCADDSSTPPLHGENGIEMPIAPGGRKQKKKKGKKKKKLSAEEEAKAAEEELLRSLEEEEESKEQQKQSDAKKKAEKKKKKRERDRLQRLREDRERREKEEMEAKRREEERKKEKERDRQRQLKQEKAMRELAEREEQLARIRKEQEEKDRKRREIEKKERERIERQRKLQEAQQLAARKEKEKADREAAKLNEVKKNAELAKITSEKISSKNVMNASGKSRGWETKSPNIKKPISQKPKQMTGLEHKSTFLSEDPMQNVPGVFDFLDDIDSPNTSSKSVPTTNQQQQSVMNGWKEKSMSPTRSNVTDQRNFDFNPEVPAIGIFREQKLAQLLKHCTSSPPLQFIGEENARLIFYNWIIRATHGSVPHLDPMIPSWTNGTILEEFFQRQLIAVTRKSGGFMNMEVLKEAGTALANQCMNAAKEVVHFRLQCNQQIPDNWADTTIGLMVSEVNGNGTMLVRIDWSGHPVHITRFTYESLKRRYIGQPLKFFSCVYAMVRRYDTWRALAGELSIGYRISPGTVMVLTSELDVSFDGRSDPTTVFGEHHFCGMFEDVDAIFGGFTPFARQGGGGDAYLRSGGSCMILFPMENTASVAYMKVILDLMECVDEGTPLSFALFLPSECFLDITIPPSVRNLPSLDHRLGDLSNGFIRHVELFGSGNHIYQYGGGDGVSRVSQTGSVFLLLQNQAGKLRYPVDDHKLKRIISSMTVNYVPNDILPSSSFEKSESTQSGTPKSVPAPCNETDIPEPPVAVQRQNSFGTDTSRSSSFAESRNRRRGRFFELEDNGDDEGLHDADVVSGMINRLDLFGNSNQDVDVEAFSLLGFGQHAKNNDGFPQ